MPDNSEIILKVLEAMPMDVGLGRARIDTINRKELGVEVGEIIEIIGKKRTGAKVFRVKTEDERRGIIRMDKNIRTNAGVSIGDKLKIKKANVKDAEKIVLAPGIGKNQRLRFGAGIENYVKNFLLKRPMVEGDHITIAGLTLMGIGGLPFVVVKTKPKKEIVQVSSETIIEILEEAMIEEFTQKISYEDIGGLGDELRKVREIIELPLKHPELFDRLGIDPPKGVLLYGAPGTGKTLIAKAVANESGATFYTINGPEIMSKYYGQSEEKLREIFQKASEKSPSIIFIDEIDSLAPKRSEVQGEVERRVVAQLLTLMDGLQSRGHVIVIGATNREAALDPALRRPGRFDREIEICIPDRNGRKEILQIHTRGMPIHSDSQEKADAEKDKLLDILAGITHGFAGADLASLAREAAMKALRRYLPEIDLDKAIPTSILEKMVVTLEDFKDALKEIEPSTLREVMIDIPNVHWEDIGNLETVKEELKDAVERPLNDPESFKKMGIKPPRGILLYGPPGTGKTLLAKAVATESQANFISIKGPEIMSKWVGESEKAIREIFKKAKQSSPTIVFLDELDSIAPLRGLHSDSGVTERLVNQLLTSMDGLESLEGVVIIGATNRPDIIDNALLRPGRFDRMVYIPPPNLEARKEIFKVHLKNMPTKDISIDKLADVTEGYTGADIKNVCREAGLIAIKEDSEIATEKHFTKSLEYIKPSLNEETIKYYDEIRNMLNSTGIIKRKEEDSTYYYG